MWERIAIIILGFWLLLRSLILWQPAQQSHSWMLDFVLSSIVIFPTLLSFCYPTAKRDLFAPMGGIAIIAFGCWGIYESGLLIFHNYLVTGLCILGIGLRLHHKTISKPGQTTRWLVQIPSKPDVVKDTSKEKKLSSEGTPGTKELHSVWP